MSTLQRRHFLRGAAGFALAIPFLPSLVKEAHAAPPKPKRFVGLSTSHGGIWTPSMFPADSALTETMEHKGHTIRRGVLSPANEGGLTKLCAVLSASSGTLTPKLLGKMNVLRGLDYPLYIGHHTGGHLGNYARNDGNGGDGKAMQAFPRPTIDQIMAWSPSFYPDLSGVKQRSLVMARDYSYNFANPATRTGDIQAQAGSYDSKALFEKIFVPPADPGSVRKPLIDRVLADYKRLRQGNRRLSAADKLRLDAHLGLLDELDRKLNVKVSCDAVVPPTKSTNELRNGDHPDFGYNPSLQGEFFGLLVDVLVAAFSCGTSRVAMLAIDQTFSDFQGDWHQDIAHKADQLTGTQQGVIASAHQRVFEKVFVELARKLDAVDEGDGTTVLDHTLVQWTQESGNVTHDGNSIPVITAGGAGGALKTGQYLDYRNVNRGYGQYNGDFATRPNEVRKVSGLLYNQWLGNVLDVMGVPRSEWEAFADAGGYGKLLVGEGYESSYDVPVLADMSGMLPWLT